eukprot:gene36555-44345_t
MTEVQSFFSGVSQAVNRRDGGLLAKVLALPLRASARATPIVRLFERLRAMGIVQACSRFGNSIGFPDMIASYLSAADAVITGDYENAYRHQNEAYNQLLDIYGSKDENMNWLIPLLVRCSNDLRCIAEVVDEFCNDVNHSCLRESLTSLVKGFTIVAKDRSPLKQAGCKKLAIFAVTNVLFKVYFKVNTLQLCGKLISVVEGPGGVMDNLSLFPCSDVVMYKYYLGRLKMFEDRYEEARDCLHFALLHTPTSQFRNRQRILVSLVPVQLALGTLPSPVLSSTYQLHELSTLAYALHTGHLALYDHTLHQHRKSFIRIGIYLVLQKARFWVYRNLFAKMYRQMNTTRMSLVVMVQVMRAMRGSASAEGSEPVDETEDLNELECMLCTLISQNRIKGYIAHEKRFLVLSKTDPFPRVKK